MDNNCVTRVVEHFVARNWGNCKATSALACLSAIACFVDSFPPSCVHEHLWQTVQILRSMTKSLCECIGAKYCKAGARFLALSSQPDPVTSHVEKDLTEHWNASLAPLCEVWSKMNVDEGMVIEFQCYCAIGLMDEPDCDFPFKELFQTWLHNLLKKMTQIKCESAVWPLPCPSVMGCNDIESEKDVLAVLARWIEWILHAKYV